MIDAIISFSVRQKGIVFVFILIWILVGIFSIRNIKLGAFPDITNNQVQVITTSRNLSTQDIEQFVTYPIELEMANLPGVKEIRSISKFGLSVVTVVFEDELGTYLPRQLIAEKIEAAKDRIPEGFGTPELGPITTGLGEIYQYTLETKPGYEKLYTPMELRTIQDWVVKRYLNGTPGVVEINTWGGFLKQYEVAVDPSMLNNYNLSIVDVFSALEKNNQNSGGAYIEKGAESLFIRGEGMVGSLQDIETIPIEVVEGIPIYIKNIAEVRFGFANRFGAITGNGQGEKVLGQVMMLKNANPNQVISEVKQRVIEANKLLPEGVFINGFLDRSELIGRTTRTITENLGFGALIVIIVVIILLGNLRSGLIVASVIPLSLLFSISMMNYLDISANLMSLGAMDFGIIIDGAVIIVEFTLFQMVAGKISQRELNGEQLQRWKDRTVVESSTKMMKSAIFGQIIILIVFIPILTLGDVEGKLFRPMAISFGLALIGAIILCLTYVPAISALLLKPVEPTRESLSDRIIKSLQKFYSRLLSVSLTHRPLVLTVAAALLALSGFLFTRIGGVFIPTLDEGDLVIQPVLKPGTSLTETIRMHTEMEKILIENFPEIDQIVTRIGAAEVPTDPMSMEMTDVIVKLKGKKDWRPGLNNESLADEMKKTLAVFPGIEFEFTQPIEMRFNELITGVRSDVAVKVYGENLDSLFQFGSMIKSLIQNVPGVSDISVEQVVGLPQLRVEYDRKALARYGINIEDVNRIIRTAYAGESTGIVFEEEKRFDLVVRMSQSARQDINQINNLRVATGSGSQMIPIKEIAEISIKYGPAQISRDNTRRRIVVGINVRNRDVQSLVEEIDGILNSEFSLPQGYFIGYGGQFENLQNARRRLSVAVPIALALIFVMLYFTFRNIYSSLLIYVAVPMATIGGVLALWIRDMPFSISAGIGFIALFGIAVLNGIILIEYLNSLKESGMADVRERIMKGATQRLRPVLLTASAAALGFFPMAFSTSSGAEVQRPLATVVIGGLITATVLTLLVLPVLYSYLEAALVKNKTDES